MIASKDEHGVHSPFIYDLYTHVIQDRTPYYSFQKVEAIRAQMLLSKEKISVEDFGTGGKEKSIRNLSLRFIASHYVKPKKYGQLLFRLVNHFHSKNILELGTSLGMTSMYLALPDKSCKVITLEGSSATAEVAKKNFRETGIENIQLRTGEFSSTLPSALAAIPNLDFVYFDGNHRREPTLHYFHSCLPYRHEHSVFVFDDIYWSAEMKNAWEEIKRHPEVTVTIDLFSIGIVFFRKGMEKQHFKLRF